METLTRAELLERVVQLKKMTSRSDIEKIIDRFYNVIIQTLGSGEVVRLSGFGNFYLLDKKQRPGRNPKTGEVIPVSERRVVTFRTGNKLKQLIDRYNKEALPKSEAG